MIDEKVDEKIEDRRGLIKFAESAIVLLYRSLPNGSENYGEARPLIGRFAFEPIFEGDECRFALDYYPAGEHRDRIGREYFGTIAVINTRDRTWKSSCDYCAGCDDECELPEQLVEDTVKVMDELGLRRVETTPDILGLHLCKK